MNKFTIENASVPDRDHLVAEIWLGENMIAEITRDEGGFNLELWNTQKVVFDFDDFLNILIEAKQKLLQ